MKHWNIQVFNICEKSFRLMKGLQQWREVRWKAGHISFNWSEFVAFHARTVVWHEKESTETWVQKVKQQ